MQCPQCGTPLPQNARFCFGCGANLSGMPAPPPPPGAPYGYPGMGGYGAPPPPPPPPAAAPPVPTAAPTPPKDLRCPACGAPLQPEFGDSVITCQYCGGTVSLAGTGWKAVNRHTMLLPQLNDPEAALKIVKSVMNTGMFHGRRFEDSKVTEQKLQLVPYWIVPSSATTNYTYQDMVTAGAATVGSAAIGSFVGNLFGGGGGSTFVAAPSVNATRQDQVTGSYQFPIVAVKGYAQYQPRNYQFNLDSRKLYKKDELPGGLAVLNGDLGEDAAQQAARAYVAQAQAEAAHKKHRMVNGLQTQVEVGDPELVHVPIWYFALDHKGQQMVVLVDANSSRVMLSNL
jgi:hypothetical protein